AMHAFAPRHAVNAEIGVGNLFHLAVGGVILDPVLVATARITRMQHRQVTVADARQLIEPIARDLAKLPVDWRHMFAEIIGQIDLQQVLKIAVDIEKVEAMAIAGDPVFQLALFPWLDLDFHIHRHTPKIPQAPRPFRCCPYLAPSSADGQPIIQRCMIEKNSIMSRDEYASNSFIFRAARLRSRLPVFELQSSSRGTWRDAGRGQPANPDARTLSWQDAVPSPSQADRADGGRPSVSCRDHAAARENSGGDGPASQRDAAQRGLDLRLSDLRSSLAHSAMVQSLRAASRYRRAACHLAQPDGLRARRFRPLDPDPARRRKPHRDAG